MTQPYYFFAVRKSGAFEVKFIGVKTLTEEQAKKWYEYYEKCNTGDVRIAVTTEHHFGV